MVFAQILKSLILSTLLLVISIIPQNIAKISLRKILPRAVYFEVNVNIIYLQEYKNCLAKGSAKQLIFLYSQNKRQLSPASAAPSCSAGTSFLVHNVFQVAHFFFAVLFEAAEHILKGRISRALGLLHCKHRRLGRRIAVIAAAV